jgi:hypothetical protein
LDLLLLSVRELYTAYVLKKNHLSKLLLEVLEKNNQVFRMINSNRKAVRKNAMYS